MLFLRQFFYGTVLCCYKNNFFRQYQADTRNFKYRYVNITFITKFRGFGAILYWKFIITD
jgi:hypothetical protein